MPHAAPCVFRKVGEVDGYPIVNDPNPRDEAEEEEKEQPALPFSL